MSTTQQQPYGIKPGYMPYTTTPFYGQESYVAQGSVPSAGEGFDAVPVYTHWGRRVGARVIDGTIATFVVMVLVVFSAVTMIPDGLDAKGDPAFTPTLAGSIALIAAGVWGIGWPIWNRCIRQGRTGQSVGKTALRIRLVSEATGEPIGAGMAFVRDFDHLLDAIAYVGYLWPLWDPRKRTFADKMCNTLVVDVVG